MLRNNTYLELSFLCHSCVSLCSIKDRGWLVIRYHNLIDMFAVKRSVMNDNRLSKWLPFWNFYPSSSQLSTFQIFKFVSQNGFSQQPIGINLNRTTLTKKNYHTVHYLFFIKTSDFGAEAERSYFIFLFWALKGNENWFLPWRIPVTADEIIFKIWRKFGSNRF